jgi:hypothetical protein
VKGIKVKAIRHLGKHDTYNMEVKDHQNFAVNGGLIVHNSGYGLVSYHISESKGLTQTTGPHLPWPLRREEKKEVKNPFLVW